jgi:hypothetical protein
MSLEVSIHDLLALYFSVGKVAYHGGSECQSKTAYLMAGKQKKKGKGRG